MEWLTSLGSTLSQLLVQAPVWIQMVIVVAIAVPLMGRSVVPDVGGRLHSQPRQTHDFPATQPQH